MIFSFALLPFIASMNCRDDAASKDPHQVLHPIGGKKYIWRSDLHVCCWFPFPVFFIVKSLNFRIESLRSTSLRKTSPGIPEPSTLSSHQPPTTLPYADSWKPPPITHRTHGAQPSRNFLWPGKCRILQGWQKKFEGGEFESPWAEGIFSTTRIGWGFSRGSTLIGNFVGKEVSF